jgi:exonuclease III
MLVKKKNTNRKLGSRAGRRKSRRVVGRKRIGMKRMRGGGDNEFTLVTYNILDAELESNFVPRTMKESNADQLKGIQLNNASLKNLYGYDSNNKPIDNLFALAGQMYTAFHSGGNFIDEETKENITKTKSRKLWGSDKPTSENSKDGKVIRNLRGLLDKEFLEGLKLKNFTIPEKTKLDEIFYEIQTENNEVRDWKTNRGNKILDKITGQKPEQNPDIICLQEYGNSKRLHIDIDNTDPQPPVTTKTREELDNDESNNPEAGSLASKLIEKGYTYRFFGYNPDTKNGDDGVAIFFKTDVFNLEEKGIKSIEMDADVVTKVDELIKKHQDKKINKYTALRRCGMVTLTHIKTNQTVTVCTAHLQSISNEKYDTITGKTNFVKELELTKIAEKFKEINGNIIFCGDFNLELVKDGTPVTIRDGNIELNAKEFTYDTPNTKSIARITPPSDGEFKYTSNAGTRTEYLDYVFSNLDGKIITPPPPTEGETMPNATEPSDHIMITAQFTIPTNQST